MSTPTLPDPREFVFVRESGKCDTCPHHNGFFYQHTKRRLRMCPNCYTKIGGNTSKGSDRTAILDKRIKG